MPRGRGRRSAQGAGTRPDGAPGDSGAVICAEGYLFELERRGYLQAGAFVPEVLFEHPEVVEQLHMDFVHAGSDVTEALTYYVHREKLRVIGREKDLVPMNKAALGIAKSRRPQDRHAVRRRSVQHQYLRSGRARPRTRRSSASSPSRSAGRRRPGSTISSPRPSPGAPRRCWRSHAIRKHSKVPAVITMAMHREDVTREGLTPGGGVPAPGGRRRRGGGHQLPPRAGDDHADDARDPRRR